MPGATSRFGFRFPSPGDPPNVPLDVQNLANDVENAVDQISRCIVVRRSTTASVPDSTVTAVTSYGSGIAYAAPGNDIAYGAGIFTVPVAGLYGWSASIGPPAGGAATFSVRAAVTQNGNQTPESPGRNVNLGNVTPWSTYGEIVLAGGDQLQLVLYQNSGSPLAIVPLQFAIHQIG